MKLGVSAERERVVGADGGPGGPAAAGAVGAALAARTRGARRTARAAPTRAAPPGGRQGRRTGSPHSHHYSLLFSSRDLRLFGVLLRELSSHSHSSALRLAQRDWRTRRGHSNACLRTEEGPKQRVVFWPAYVLTSAPRALCWLLLQRIIVNSVCVLYAYIPLTEQLTRVQSYSLIVIAESVKYEFVHNT